MKNAILNRSLLFLKKYKTYSEEETNKLKYGLEGIYLTLSKLIVIIGLSIILGIFKEVITLLALFNILRYFGFGVHAKKSSECLIFSILCFVGLPLFLLNIKINKDIILIIGIVCILLLFIFAPADTKKRPFPKTRKKLFRKLATTILSIVFLTISLYSKDYTLSILLWLAIIIETILVNPITYMILKQPYNNYKNVV